MILTGTLQTITHAYSEIEQNRQFTVQQMLMVHETLNAFQQKFQQELEDLGTNLKNQINEEAAVVRATWDANHKRMYNNKE